MGFAKLKMLSCQAFSLSSVVTVGPGVLGIFWKAVSRVPVDSKVDKQAVLLCQSQFTM